LDFRSTGELCNFAAYAFVEAIIVVRLAAAYLRRALQLMPECVHLMLCFFFVVITQTPLGALSVVLSAILSHFILKERLSLFGWIGSIQCILGAAILAINAPPEQSVSDIAGFKKFFLAPGFLAYGSVVIATSVVLVVYVAPRWGKKTMFPHIGICSLIGGLSVSCTQGLGACILTSIRGQNQVGAGLSSWFGRFAILMGA
jgi:magnesium transporter